MDEERGFSLVELLVVIVIIAILASIAIPIFVRQRDKAYLAQVESALKNAATAMEARTTETGGRYAGIKLQDLEVEGLKYSNDVSLELKSSAKGYCFTASHKVATHIVRYWDSALGRPDGTDCRTKY